MKYYKIGMAMFGRKSRDTIIKSKTYDCKSVICQSHGIFMKIRDSFNWVLSKFKEFPSPKDLGNFYNSFDKKQVILFPNLITYTKLISFTVLLILSGKWIIGLLLLLFGVGADGYILALQVEKLLQPSLL